MEKLIPKCKICKETINVSLIKGLFSDMFLNEWICQKCSPKYSESKKSLQIKRLEV